MSLASDAGLTFESLSMAEKRACFDAWADDAIAAYPIAGMVQKVEDWQLNDAASSQWAKGWVACKLWTLDHLIAMSAEIPQSILDVVTKRALTADVPSLVWDGLDEALNACYGMSTKRKRSTMLPIRAARQWLDEHRP